LHRIRLQEASQRDEPLLERLHQLHRHDLSEFSGQALPADGRYTGADVPRYLGGSPYAAYLFTVAAEPAGFALVNHRSHAYAGESVRNLDDFFILRKWRRQGIGTEAARLLFARFPGLWQVNKRTYNLTAMAFWGRVVPALSGGDFTEHVAEGDIHMHVLRVSA
jgi:predicted acetyltransferase